MVSRTNGDWRRPWDSRRDIKELLEAPRGKRETIVVEVGIVNGTGESRDGLEATLGGREVEPARTRRGTCIAQKGHAADNARGFASPLRIAVLPVLHPWMSWNVENRSWN